MWRNKYRDYPVDGKFKKEQKKTVGCEMNEIYGWGEKYHSTPEKPSLFKKLLRRFGKKS